MQFQIKQTDAGYVLSQMQPKLIGTFPDKSMAENIAAFLGSQAPLSAPQQVSETVVSDKEDVRPAPTVPTMPATGAAQLVKAAIADVKNMETCECGRTFTASDINQTLCAHCSRG